MPAAVPTDPALPAELLLPIRSLIVTLEFIEPGRPAFFHQAALSSFVRELMGSPEGFDRMIRVDAVESSRVSYAPSRFYRFQLIALGGSDGLLRRLFEALRGLPRTASRQDARVPFRDNLRLHAVHDAFNEAAVESPEALCAYDQDSLADEVLLWHGLDRLHWRWLSPVQLLKAKEKRPPGTKGDARFCRDSTDLDAALLLNRAHDALADLLRRRGEDVGAQRGQPPALELESPHLYWIENEYFDAAARGKKLGGMAGEFDLLAGRRLSPAWWKLLVLGQFTGIGQRTAFGWGRYQLHTPEGGVTWRRALPAASFLMEADTEENLRAAWAHVLRNSEKPDDPEEPDPRDHWIDPFEDLEPPDEDWEEPPPEPPLEDLHRRMAELLGGEYSPPAMRGHIQRKPNGGLRPLAVPPFQDRVLQRALAQVIGPGIDSLFHPRSHGFRPGRSRLTASDDIQAAWQAGYRWVYESDIADFFDSVDLDRLADRLRTLFGEDPLIDAILAWMRAPVVVNDPVTGEQQLIERRNGLPQGAPLSPLMANLMLDDFDADMRHAGFHLVRFADDFIVLCKDPAEAQAADAAARASLAEHGLSLNEDKTRITAMADGFRYLGYLFVNDLVIDVGGQKRPAGAPKPVHPNSWLAHIAARPAERLQKTTPLVETVQRLKRRQATAIGERDQERTLLCVTGDVCVLTTRNKHLRVLRDDKILYDLPWRSLQAVLLFGNHQITTQAMRAALRTNTAIHLSGYTGRYEGVLWNGYSAFRQHDLWQRQIQCAEDPEFALYIGREITLARLRHIKEHLRQRGAGWDDPAIDHAIQQASAAPDLDRLRGLEGAAARAYFGRLAQIVPAEFGFDGRNRQPPRDPFNALLSLGYTLLYGYSESVLRVAGLLPWRGFIHQPRGRHAALASDLMEPFRHVVERTALRMLSRNQLTPEDFSQTPAGASRIADDARRAYLAKLLERFEGEIRAKGEAEPRKLYTHLHRQALSLRNCIRHGEPFRVWRLR